MYNVLALLMYRVITSIGAMMRKSRDKQQLSDYFASSWDQQRYKRLINVRTLMIQRCYNKNVPHYHRYGGRGIKVCARWLESYKHFIADMGIPEHGLEIDRIDNDGDYEPGNCRWTTRTINQRNSAATKLAACEVRDIRKYLVGGKSVKDIAFAYNVTKSCIYDIKANRTWL